MVVVCYVKLINRINIFTIKIKMLSSPKVDNVDDDKVPNTICAICLEPAVKPKVLQCNHSFCIDCIMKWFETAKFHTCPCCKQVDTSFESAPMRCLKKCYWNVADCTVYFLRGLIFGITIVGLVVCILIVMSWIVKLVYSTWVFLTA
jgi:hypothetical protein